MRSIERHRFFHSIHDLGSQNEMLFRMKANFGLWTRVIVLILTLNLGFRFVLVMGRFYDSGASSQRIIYWSHTGIIMHT